MVETLIAFAGAAAVVAVVPGPSTADMVWYLTLIWLAGHAGRAFGRPSVRRRLEQVSGVVLVGLGLRLAAESR